MTEIIVSNNGITFNDNINSNVLLGNQDHPKDLIIWGNSPSNAETYASNEGHTFRVLGQMIDDIETLNNIEVKNGTTKENIGLPSEVKATLSDGSKRDIPVTWDDGSPAYDKSQPEEYTFTGQLEVPNDIVNPNNLKVTVKVIVELPKFEWTENTDDTVTITKYNGTDTDITIPDRLDGKDVTVIGQNVIQNIGLTKMPIIKMYMMIIWKC